MSFRVLQSSPPGFVLDNLIFHVDAANSHSYPGSGTTWTDLAGSYDGTLINSPTFTRPALEFNGSTQYVDFGASLDDSVTTMPITMEMWARNDGLGGWAGFHTSSNPDFSLVGGVSLGFDNTTPSQGIAIQYGDGTNRRSNVFSGVITAGDWTHIVGIVKGQNDLQLYLNGSSVGGGGYSGSGGATIGNVSGGTAKAAREWTAGVGYMPGGISLIRLYTDELTPAEIVVNFNAERGRFGV